MPRKKSQKSKSKKQFVSYGLPAGFWQQVFAVFLIVLAVLIMFSWFKAGGPVLDSINQGLLKVIGYGTFVFPFLLIYIGLEIFRSENNKVSPLLYVASFAMLTFTSAFFGLAVKRDFSTGGVLGDSFNDLMLQLVVSGVAVFVEFVLIALTAMYLFRITPHSVYENFKMATAKVHNEAANDSRLRRPTLNSLPIMNSTVKENSKLDPKFEVVEGVPIAKADEPKEDKQSHFSSFKNSAPRKVEEESKPALVVVQDPDWKNPPIDILGKKQSPADAGDVKQNAEIIQNTLHEFGIDVEMTGANVGPKVTQYTLTPTAGVKLTRIAALENNIALNLAAQSLRIEAPIPGKRAVGIEVPNVKAADVRLRGIIDSSVWKKATEKLTFAIGRNISGEPIVAELNEMPHLLIAGQTGSGKSVMINVLLTSLLYHNSPSDLKLILVDPKQVEMAPYEDIPHLLCPIINDPTHTLSALKWAVNEMERRYTLLAAQKKRDIKSYNQYILENNKSVEIEDENGNVQEHNEGAMPYIVIVIDELSDLMMTAARDVEALIVRIAQKARAVGIHLVLATQRPSVNVVTGLIKANVPARIAFTVASQVDSKTILDKAGAEKLLGKGDMLFMTAKMNKPARIQGAWVTDEEIAKITDFLREQRAPEYNDEIINQEVNLPKAGGIFSGDMSGGGGGDEELLRKAVEVVLNDRKASTTLLQRRLRIGYARAARMMEELEERGVVGPQDGSRAREVLISSMDDLI